MKNYIERSFTYDEYLALIDELSVENKTTGPKQSESLVQFTKLNRQRMKRLDKTIVLSEEIKKAANGNDRKQIWLTITEGWCGDAAQNIPIIEKIAAESDIIETRYILRDENLDLMDQFLTFGARSIPKLITLEMETLDVLGTWGARPKAAQELFFELKEKGVEKQSIMESLQRWYNEDQGSSIQNEFVELLSSWTGRKTGAANV